MTDLKIDFDSDLLEGDLLFADNDLTTDDGLVSAVMISWFTDQRAGVDDEIPNADANQEFVNKRGWWGDLVDPIIENDKIGSLLWLLSRSKITQENLTKAVEYGTQALEWMKEDGIAKKINVTSERLLYKDNDYILALKAEIIKTDGNKLNISFDPEWFATIAV